MAPQKGGGGARIPAKQILVAPASRPHTTYKRADPRMCARIGCTTETVLGEVRGVARSNGYSVAVSGESHGLVDERVFNHRVVLGVLRDAQTPAYQPHRHTSVHLCADPVEGNGLVASRDVFLQMSQLRRTTQSMSKSDRIHRVSTPNPSPGFFSCWRNVSDDPDFTRFPTCEPYGRTAWCHI